MGMNMTARNALKRAAEERATVRAELEAARKRTFDFLVEQRTILAALLRRQNGPIMLSQAELQEASNHFTEVRTTWVDVPVPVPMAVWSFWARFRGLFRKPAAKPAMTKVMLILLAAPEGTPASSGTQTEASPQDTAESPRPVPSDRTSDSETEEPETSRIPSVPL
jgi:hypothetical protein